jgi:hypothetical protein
MELLAEETTDVDDGNDILLFYKDLILQRIHYEIMARLILGSNTNAENLKIAMYNSRFLFNRNTYDKLSKNAKTGCGNLCKIASKCFYDDPGVMNKKNEINECDSLFHKDMLDEIDKYLNSKQFYKRAEMKAERFADNMNKVPDLFPDRTVKGILTDGFIRDEKLDFYRSIAYEYLRRNDLKSSTKFLKKYLKFMGMDALYPLISTLMYETKNYKKDLYFSKYFLTEPIRNIKNQDCFFKFSMRIYDEKKLCQLLTGVFTNVVVLSNRELFFSIRNLIYLLFEKLPEFLNLEVFVSPNNSGTIKWLKMEIIEPFIHGCYLYIKSMCNKEQFELVKNCINNIKVCVLFSDEKIIHIDDYYLLNEMLNLPVYNLYSLLNDNCYLLKPPTMFNHNN